SGPRWGSSIARVLIESQIVHSSDLDTQLVKACQEKSFPEIILDNYESDLFTGKDMLEIGR
ncbi:MAG: hypothetical protein ACKOB4_04550, partial [Acidobacteriota bacterium]